MAAGVTVSFVAPPELVARLQSIASADGVSASKAASMAVMVGLLLTAPARRTFRFVQNEGGQEACLQLRDRISRAVAAVGSGVLERQLLAHGAQQAEQAELSEDKMAAEAVAVVRQHRREREGEKPEAVHLPFLD